MTKKVLIVGGVAGGASTAARLRRLDETCDIILFERGDYISFANCGLPYYIGDTITDRDALLVQTPEKMFNRFKIDVRIKNEVLSIDRENKKVSVKNLATQETYEESYDTLVLSTGSSPLKPGIPGIDSPNIFTLWNIPDTDTIKNFLNERKPSKAVVVGGGFIGLEMAENLHALGIDVSIVEMLDQVMAPIDYEMAQAVHQNISCNHVDLHLKDGVKKFESKGSQTIVTLQSGKELITDIVLLSIGVKPNGELAKNCGLDSNEKGGIKVDDFLKTSDENIYAIGDVIEVTEFVEKGKTMIPLAGPANKQGRICANNICGAQEKYNGTQGTAIAKVFDLAVASTGLNEKTLKKMGKVYKKDYLVTLISAKSHAGYYPGALTMALKMIFDFDGKILGAQIVGQDGVDKRIDTIATTMRLRGTIYDLKELELAYAPPFSSAKDPVNMLGFTAENLLTDKVDFVLPDEFNAFDKKSITVLDVGEPEERMLGFIDGSVNIPLGQIRNRLSELDPDSTIVAYCAVGLRSYIASRILSQNGFNNVKVLAGGYSLYKSAAKPTTTDSKPSVENEENLIMNNVDLKSDKIVKVNCCGLQCPGPIMQVYGAMNELEEGGIIEVTSTDLGFVSDIGSWCNKTGNTLLKTEKHDKDSLVFIQKGNSQILPEHLTCPTELNVGQQTPKGKTMVVFNGELDKAIASFIIANGAVSMGSPVTMFFTFWGLNILRKTEPVSVKKPFMDKMFGMMMPRGSKKLQISNMNMMGMGAQMIRKVMKDKNVDSLETLMKMAMDNGVRVVACTMSMDVMGITKEELIDGVELAGVATYLDAADDSNVNLFI